MGTNFDLVLNREALETLVNLNLIYSLQEIEDNLKSLTSSSKPNLEVNLKASQENFESLSKWHLQEYNFSFKNLQASYKTLLSSIENYFPKR